jgi:hypothetical protein
VTLAVPVGPPTVTINRDDRVVVCQPDGRIEVAEQEGLRFHVTKRGIVT